MWCQIPKMKEIDDTVQAMLEEVSYRENELRRMNSPYRKVEKKKVPFFVTLAKKLPLRIRLAIHELMWKQKYNFIEK